jgi:hypothetical protein
MSPAFLQSLAVIALSIIVIVQGTVNFCAWRSLQRRVNRLDGLGPQDEWGR